MYLCIYIATYLHWVYLDWQHTVIVSNLRCAWRWRRICTPRRSVHLHYPSISVNPQLLINDVLGCRDQASWETHFEAEIKWTQRYTPRPWSSEFGDALWGRDRARLEMQLETNIEWTQRCTGRPWSSKLGDAIGDRDWVNSEMHWEALIERVWTCTWRPRSSEHRDELRAVIDRV